MLAAAAAGADVVDVAIDSMSGLTSQPAMGAVCAALEQSNLGTGIRYDDIQALNLYWTQVRMMYSCFEANVRASDSSVFDHEMPGGQYTNLMVCVECYDIMACLTRNISSKPLSWVLELSGRRSRRSTLRPTSLYARSFYL